MSDVLDEAYGVVQCKECPWYKTCVIPMKITAEDIRRQLESSATGGETGQPMDFNVQNMISGMASAAQNSILEGCPVFIERLRASQELAQKIKKLMQEWGKEIDEKTDSSAQE